MNSPDNIQQLAPTAIGIPDERSTSVVDDKIMEEIKSSIKERGILTPLLVLKVDGKLILVDGLHRLVVARELGFPTVPCIVREGSMTDVLIENMITARQHGKSDPVGEALVLKTLMEEEKLSQTKAAQRLHISPSWARQIMKINLVGDRIKEMVKFGDLGVAHVQYLADIQDPSQQLTLAMQAIEWRYSAETMKAAVTKIVNPDYMPAEGETIIEASGAPSVVPVTCFICRNEVGPEGSYIWLCPKDKQLIKESVPLIMGEEEASPSVPTYESTQQAPQQLYSPPQPQPQPQVYPGHYPGPPIEGCQHIWQEHGPGLMGCRRCDKFRKYQEF